MLILYLEIKISRKKNLKWKLKCINNKFMSIRKINLVLELVHDSVFDKKLLIIRFFYDFLSQVNRTIL